jgi:AraC-like DNA-binding protein
MNVVTLLDPLYCARVRRALGVPHTVEDIGSDAATINAKTASADVVVVDPLRIEWRGEGPPNWVAESKDKMIAYASPTPEAMHATILLVQSGVGCTLLAGYDDSSASLRRNIESTRARSLAQRANQLLGPEFSRLPAALADVLRRAILRPATHATAETVCREAGAARRSCDRWTRQAGLHSLGRLLRAARALHIVSYLRDKKLTLATIAERTGLGTASRLTALSNEVFGASASQLRTLTEDALLRRFVVFVRDTAR